MEKAVYPLQAISKMEKALASQLNLGTSYTIEEPITPG
jgi:hypothetical protein